MYREIEPFVGEPLPDDYMSYVDESSPFWAEWALKALWHARVPRVIQSELATVADMWGITKERALLLNLMYEVGAGGACLSSAVATDKGPRVFRQLEWGLPDNVFSKCVETSDGLVFQQITGCVGVYDGMRDGTVMAINMPPDYDQAVNPMGTPAAWLVRAALQRDADKVAWLIEESGPVCRPAFVLTLGDGVARHVHLSTIGEHKVLAEGGEVHVGNDWEQDPKVSSEVERFVRAGVGSGVFVDDCEPSSEGGTPGSIVADRLGVLHSVVYNPSA